MDTMISYAQNNEDVILKRVFHGKDNGFYIDIGAFHPEELSVTKHFYDLGWRGINVEPLKKNYELFIKDRPLDLNLNVAVDETKGSCIFYEVTDCYELSTFFAEAANTLIKEGHTVNSYQIETITGQDLFSKCDSISVDFMKIDVEGSEYKVLKSIDFQKFRPKVLVIEATIPNSKFPGWPNIESIFNHNKWEPILLKSGYIFVYFDGLNRFYVRNENKEYLDYFKVGLCCWDNYENQVQANRIAELEWNAAERLKQIEILTKLLKESEIDRAVRKENIEQLTKMLKESEIDRELRGQQITKLTNLINTSEADRLARMQQIEALIKMLKKN